MRVVRKLFLSPGHNRFMAFVLRRSFGKAMWSCYSILASISVIPFALVVVVFGRLVVMLRKFREEQKGVPKILFVSHESALNGAPISLYNFLKSLDREKFEPIAVTREMGPLNELLENAGVPVVVLPFSVLLRQRFEGARTWHNLVIFCWGIPFTTLFLLAQSVDIVHTNVSCVPDFAFSARCIGLKNVWHFRETLMGGLGQKIQVATLFGLAHRIICISEYASSVLDEKKRHSKIQVVYNALYTKEFVDASMGRDMKEEFNIPEGAPVIGVVGQIAPDKGQEYFVRAACIVHKTFPDSIFLIVGSTEYEEYIKYLKSIAWDQGLSKEHLIFTGIRNDIPKIIHGMDIVVVPSVWQEMFGRVTIEGMYCKRPVVGTTQGAIPEIVTHNETGLLVPPKDEKALSEAISRLVRDPEERKRFGQNGNKRVIEKFSMNSHARSVEKCYAELLGK